MLKSRILNVALNQAGWFACVLGAAYGRPWTGSLIALAFIAVHLLLIKQRLRELCLLLIAALIGTLLDTLQSHLGVVRFSSGHIIGWLCPLWITMLWAQFASLMHISLNWLSGRYMLAALFGVVGGPLAFFAGARLGAADLHPDIRISLGALALEWAIAMPLLVWLAERLPVRPGYRLLDPDRA
jgi:hypothetical protein